MSKPIPLTPSTQVKGGGQFDFPYDDIDVTITGAKTVKRDFITRENVTKAKDVPQLMVEYTPDGGGDPRWAEYGAGGAERVQPSEDGTGFVGANNKEFAGLTDTSRAGFFFKKLIEAGFPESKFDLSVGFLIGTKGHIRQVDPPKNGNDSDNKKVPVFTKVTETPGGAAAPVDGSQVTELAKKIIAAALKQSNGAAVTKVQLSQIANKALKPKVDEGKLTNATLLEVVKTVLDEKFLKTEVAWKSTGSGVQAKAADAEEIAL